MFALKFIKHHRVFASTIYRNNVYSHKVLSNNVSDNHLNVKIMGEDLKFPYIWLRDNCQCEQCYHKSAKSRILDWLKFDLNITTINVLQKENVLEITWSDGHKSIFNHSWLKFRSFTAENQKRYTDTIYKPEQVSWQGSDFSNICSKHDYKEVINADQALYNWLYNLSVYGVALIENTPDSERAIDAVVERIGFTKQTHYGVKFIVQNIANTSNVAYLSSNLQMHTDLPYYEYCPGVNLLHCLVQTASQGGENLLSDCHFVADYMKKNHPGEYKLLTEVEIEWSDVGVENDNEFFKLYRSPVICLDKNDQITRISFSIPQRGSQILTDLDTVVLWYKAHGLFLELNHRFSAKFKTKPGDILVFNNIRLLHGRNAYEDNSSNIRKLIGAYVDWDEIYSRLRCLTVKQNIDVSFIKIDVLTSMLKPKHRRYIVVQDRCFMNDVLSYIDITRHLALYL
ncbi:hypothetical protein K1T71_001583 [Dendrolimus kikuchii]|uniref:Uncharacterized protein n=1 Tax=Dendrolimus kikuchii TaxID=765133 RepID=A0ACC1DEN0_9NEOP|nr:hypothetical protein K1T71_001583 [Dendrolimus kikuchii]